MKKPAVLIAEGDEVLRQELRHLLHCGQAELIETTSQRGLPPALQARNPDLVIVGSTFDNPGESLEVAQAIRRSNRQIPIILITASSSEDLAIAALRAGINDYLRTPFSVEELNESVNRCLT